MATRTYREFDLLAEKAKRDRSGLRGLTVRLLASPDGDGLPVRHTISLGLARELSDALVKLETRQLDTAGILLLGRLLGDVLFPSAIRARLGAALDGLRPDEGLRIRLRLDPALAEIPWEFAWIEHQEGQRDSTGYLVLDPRVSVVRHQTFAGRIAVDGGPRDRRVLAALANPAVPGKDPLDLPTERANLSKALKGVPGISVDFVDDATIETLTDALQTDVDVFHFAGHGIEDNLVLVDEVGGPYRLPAEQLAIDLRARGVRMAILGACESAERSGREPWSGVATRLISAGIPAVVAMQYNIGDRSAVAFSDRLYRSLAAGLSLDEAVAAGRLAIFDTMNGGRRTTDKARLWQDWGVPVIYMRPDASVTLASIADAGQRAALAEELAVNVRLRIGNVMKGGRVVVVDAGVISAGHIDADVKTGDIGGELTVVKIDRLGGGTVDANLEAEDVTGEVIGVQIGQLGGRSTPRRTDR